MNPFLRSDWRALMTYARSLGLVNNVWTSGLPLRKKSIARQVYEVTTNGFVSEHVDSVNPDGYVENLGSQGFWRVYRNTVRELQENSSPKQILDAAHKCLLNNSG